MVMKMGRVNLMTGTEYLASGRRQPRSADSMWSRIGPEKTQLLKDWGFDIVGNQFVKQANSLSEPWILEFEYVRDTPLAKLPEELVRSPSRPRE
jgi:hypothetical protein